MANLVVTTFVTLDGVMQAPGGPKEDTDGGFEHGGWLVPFFDDDMGPYIDRWFRQAAAFLLGRRTYQIFASHWPFVTDEDDPVATALNTMPKYVASRTLDEVDWTNSTLIQGDVPAAVAGLKREVDGELQVHGSGNLVQTLLAHDLVDEFRLMSFPVALGTGKRLFGDGTVPTQFRLRETGSTRSGVIVHVYDNAGRPEYGAVGLDTQT